MLSDFWKSYIFHTIRNITKAWDDVTKTTMGCMEQMCPQFVTDFHNTEINEH